MRKRMLSTLCPSCGLPMQTAAMSCTTCGVKIEGNFSQTYAQKKAVLEQLRTSQISVAEAKEKLEKLSGD